MRDQPILATITLFSYDENSPFEVTVNVNSREYRIGSYWSAYDAAGAMAKWTRDRGLDFAKDSARRLDRAQRAALSSGSKTVFLTLDVVRYVSEP